MGIYQIQAAVKEHDLEKDPDVVAFKAANMQLVSDMSKSNRGKSRLEPEQEKDLINICKQAGAPFTLPPLSDKVIPFEQFITIYSVIIGVTVRFIADSSAKQKTDRRILLKAKKEKEYQMLCQKHMMA